MLKYFADPVEELSLDAAAWLKRGKRAHDIKLSDETLERALRLRKSWPELFAQKSVLNNYLDAAEENNQRQQLIESVKGGHVTSAVSAMRLVQLRPQDKGSGIRQLRPPLYAALTSDTTPDAGDDYSAGLHHPSGRKSIFDDARLIQITTGRGMTTLNWAVVAGHFDLVRDLIARGADPRRLTDSGSSLLADAAYCGHLELVRYLIDEHGIDVNHADHDDSSPLLWAIQQDHKEVVSHLLSRGASLDIRTRQGWSTFTEAVRSGNIAMVKELLDANPGRAKERTLSGITPLAVACQEGKPTHTAIASMLVEAGADPKECTEARQSLFHIAAYSGNPDIIRFLLSQGLSLDCVDQSGNTPLHDAIGAYQPAIAALLIEMGADVDALDNQGSSPLTLAASGGYHDMVRMLLDHGADPNKRGNRSSWMPVHAAAADADLPILDTLIKNKRIAADLDATIEPYWSPVTIAARYGNADCLIRLLDARADYDTQDILRWAKLHNHGDVLEKFGKWLELHEIKEDVPASDSDEEAPTLFDVARKGDVARIKTMLEAGAACDEPDEFGQRPVDIAASHCRIDAVKALMDAGAAPPLIWSHPRVSDQATFLEFNALAPSEATEIRRALPAFGAALAINPKVAALRSAALPFYGTARLLAIENEELKGQREQFATYSPGGDMCLLDWSNTPIYHLNGVYDLDLSNDELVKSYCRFFFHFVRGKLGHFQIVEKPEDLSWREPNEEAYEKVRNLIKPLTVESRDVFAKLDASILFKNALFNSKILIRLQADEGENAEFVGLIALSDDNLLAEELLVLPQLPPGPLG